MKKTIAVASLLILGASQCFAYYEPLYNGCGNRIGQALVKNDSIEWYDIDYHKVEGVKALIDSYEKLTKNKKIFVVGTKSIPICDQSVCKEYVYYYRNGEYVPVPYKHYKYIDE